MGRKLIQHMLRIMLAILIISIGFFVLPANQTAAVQSVPYQMNFQGRLNNASGAPMASGTYNMKFTIYSVSTGGTALWTETHAVSTSTAVTVTSGGLFSVQLGSVTGLPSTIFNSSAPLYLAVELPTPATATSSSPAWTEGAMSPRNPIESSPYAINSDLLDGLDSSAFATASGSTNYIQNTTSPQAASFNVTGSGVVSGTFTATGASVFKDSTNSATAFQIQNAAGVAALNIDTTTNSVVLGSGGNTVTFSAAGVVAAGSARHTKTVLLPAEYAGAVLDAASDATCSSANNGIMTSGYDSTNRMNFYNWTSTQATAQCYNVVVQVPIPSDFDGWTGTPSINLKKDSNGTGTYAVKVVDSTGTTDSNYNYTTPGTLGTTWSNIATSAFGNTAGTNGTTSYVPGGYFTIKVRMSSTSGANVSLGNISLTYNSKF